MHRCSNSKTGFVKRERERVTLFTRGVEPGANNTQFLALVARKERQRFPRRGASNTGQDRLAQSNTDYQKRTQTQTMAQTVWLKVCIKDIQTFSNRAQHRLWYRNTVENGLWHNVTVTQIMTNEQK